MFKGAPLIRISLMLVAAMAVLSTAGAARAQEADEPGRSFVLQADGVWSAAQDAAVAAAGGVVTFRHPATGIAIARSERADFAARVAKGSGIKAALDEVHNWQPNVTVSDVEMTEDVVTPNDETFINEQWNVRAIEADGAWNAGYTGLGVRVAIIDGGIHSTHIDLAANLDVAASRSFVPGFNFNQDVGTFWHGTHVAGIVAAADNGIGTIGVAPKATIIGVKVLHSGSGSFGQVISGILYAADPLADGGAGADIINMSLGATFERGGGNTGAGQLVATVARAVNYATSKGVLVVTSAGNSAIDMDHAGSVTNVPAQSGSALAIAATGPVGYAVGWPNGATNFRRPASYTNYGNSLVWLAAPGGDSVLPGNAPCTIPRVPVGNVTVPCWVHDMVMSTVRGSAASISTYGWAAGTSMAAPAVAAVAAIVKQRFPGMDAGTLKTFLAQTADDEGKLGNDPFYGKGFVNARRAATEMPGGLASEPATREETAARTFNEVWLAASPSPARAGTTLRFGLPREAEVALAVFDASGRRVGRPAAGRMAAGEHSVRWDLMDGSGARVQPGLYFAKLMVDGRATVSRIVVLP